MFPQDLGTNRLRSGFRGQTMRRSASHPGTPSDSEDEDSPSPIRIRDFETEDEETDGGMTLNVQGHGDHATPIVISDDEDTEPAEVASVHESELEEGEEREETNTTQDKEMVDVHQQEKQASNPPELSFVIDSTPGTSQTHLRDLNTAQLEEQIKYAFWQYPRDEIDLSRLARCLHCQNDGHIDEACPAKRCQNCNAYAEHDSILCPSVKRCQRCREPGHSDCQGMKKNTVPCDICALAGHAEDDCPIKYYTQQAIPVTETLELWISCCGCASKSHLIGDCPQISPAKAIRWSLRSIGPDKVVNLSIQTGIEKWEKEVENRNMRPEGIKIRGRANRHTADVTRRDASESDELENFFSRPPPRDIRRDPLPRGQHVDQYRPGNQPRYDRYDGYNGPSDTYRPPRNGYYATDSFGRPRSRSPPRYAQQGRGRGRQPSLSPTSSHDYYHPSDEDLFGRRSPPMLRDNPSRRGQQDPPQQTLPARGISIQLPTRKGSNPSLQNGPPASLPSRPPAPGQPGSTKNSNKQNNNNHVAQMGAYQVQQAGLSKTQQRKLNKKKKKGKGPGHVP